RAHLAERTSPRQLRSRVSRPETTSTIGFASIDTPRKKVGPAILSSHGIRQRGEVEVAHAERRHQPSGSSGFRAADILEAIQHQQRAFVPAEVLQRSRDLAVLDQKGAVSRQPGLKYGARIQRPDVEEVRDEDAAG